MTRLLRAAVLALPLLLAAAGPAAADGPSVPALLDQAAAEFNVDPVMLRRTAWCESNWRPWATSPWGHRGVLQFSRVTWIEQAPTLGLSPDFREAYDAQSNIRLGAALMARGQRWRWSCR